MKIGHFHSLRCLLLATALMLCAHDATAEDRVPFLKVDDLPNAVNYLPPPPDFSSELFKSDLHYYNWGKWMRANPRGVQAREDAEHSTEKIAKAFSAVMGIDINSKKTPYLYALIGRTQDTASLATKKAKKFHQRPRPYAHFRELTLIPEAESSHNAYSSYPSGHASMGWAVALVLAEINPENQDKILQRGYEYGTSRIIAGYHYESDVNAGRLAASAAVARMHADFEFNAYMERAKQEFIAAKQAPVFIPPALPQPVAQQIPVPAMPSQVQPSVAPPSYPASPVSRPKPAEHNSSATKSQNKPQNAAKPSRTREGRPRDSLFDMPF